MLFMTSRLDLILNVEVQLDITGPRKDNSIPTYNQGELYIQVNLLYKPREITTLFSNESRAIFDDFNVPIN